MRLGARLCALLALAPAVAAAADWNAALDRGEIMVYRESVPGEAETRVVMQAVIERSPLEVLRLIEDCDRYRVTMPRIRSARRDSKGAGWDICTVTVAMPFPYKDATATSRATNTIRDGGRTIRREWRLLSGDYERNEGSWTLTPFRGDAGRTLAVYRAFAKPRAWVPAWIRRAAETRVLPETIERFRKVLGAPPRVASGTGSR
jgi:hypothetical protein